MKRVLKDKLAVISDEIKKSVRQMLEKGKEQYKSEKRILAYCEISSKIEVVSHDCLFFNNLGEEAI